MRRLNKGQSLLEYVLLVGIAIIALLASNFIPKAISGFGAHFQKASNVIVSGAP